MENDNNDPARTQARRAYVAPRVEESAPFEHLVLGCARSSLADESCVPDGDDTMITS